MVNLLTEYRVLFIFMLSVVMLSVVILSIVILSVVMLNVTVLSVVAPRIGVGSKFLSAQNTLAYFKMTLPIYSF
jgi:hypothetical protein